MRLWTIFGHDVLVFKSTIPFTNPYMDLQFRKYLLREHISTGNEITCDCRLRPLRRLLLEDWSKREDWKDVLCTLPRLVAGKSILGANEEDMYCNGDSVLENEEYDTTPDIKFREVERYSIL